MKARNRNISREATMASNHHPSSPPGKPLIIAMKGHPGSGKTTIARALSSRLRCPLLDKDDIRDSTFPIQKTLECTATPSSAARTLLNDLSYSVLWRITETQLKQGLPAVVIDSPLSRRAHLESILEIGGKVEGARVVVVECRSGDEEEWRRRLEERATKDAEDEGASGGGWHKPRSWEELRRIVDGYGGQNDYDLGEVPRIVVDTTAAETAAAVAGVMQFVESYYLNNEKMLCCSSCFGEK